MSEKKHYASPQFLTYKHPMYQGCTFEEVVILAAITCLADIALNVVANLIFRNVYLLLPIFGVASFLCFFTFKKVSYRIGDYKQDKPHGYVMKTWRRFLFRTIGVKPPFVTYQGKWSTSRSVK